jgi:aerobic carbon-monoxide dehydrogenase small subunit
MTTRSFGNGMLTVGFTLNGEQVASEVRPEQTVLDMLREQWELMSVRPACGIGVCGSCTVLVDWQVASSCIMLAAAVDGRDVTTAEGLANGGALCRTQQAFVERGAYQCSYCIPAMALTAEAYVAAHPEATHEEVRHHLAGNLCRCGTYPMVLEAVADVLQEPS